jgi:hypothetical protein
VPPSQGTVGLLKAVLTADVANYTAGMKAAATGSDGVKKSVEGLSKEVLKFTPQAERMHKAFGGDRLLYQANSLASAVQKLGGAQKLTALEQARVNKTVSEAIEKYRLLGKEAPKALTDLAAATRRVSEVAKSKDLDLLARGMSAAGKEATASSKLIAGMSQSGRTELARLAQSTAQPVTAFQRMRDMLGPMSVSIAAAFSVGAVINFGREIARFSGRMVDLSDETQISTSRLQAWDRVLTNAGLSVEDLVRAATELQKRLGNGDESAAAAMRKLGISASELIQMKSDEAVIKIVEATSKLGTQSEKTTVLFELLGRVGPRMLRVAGTELGKTIDEISKSSDIIRDDMILKADQFDDHLDRVIKSMKARIVNFVGWYQDQQKEIGLLPFGIDLPMRTPNAPGAPAMFSPGVIGPNAPTGLPSPNYAQSLAVARKAVADLTQAQREEILASQEMNLSAAGTADMLKRFGLQAYSLQTILSLLKTKTKEATDEITQFSQIATTDAINRFRMENFGWNMNASLAAQGITGKPTPRDVLPNGGLLETNDTSGLRNILSTSQRLRGERGIRFVVDEWREQWKGLQTEMIGGFSDGLARMLTGLRGFKETFLDIWGSIRQSFASIVSGLVQTFLTGYVGKLAGALGIGAASAGTAAAVGGGAAAAAGGTAAAVGGGAAAGGGLGATIAGLATNPFTIAAAGGLLLGLGIWKGGWFRGGEEGTKVNPRRDQFTGQFGGDHALAAKLTSLGAGAGGGPLFSALQGARTVKAFESSEDSIIRFFAQNNIRNVRKYNLGGFVPPGAVQPAIVHGGSMGEIIAPVEKLLQAGRGGKTVNVTFHVTAWDSQDAERGVRKAIPFIKRAFELNTDDLLGHTKRVLG